MSKTYKTRGTGNSVADMTEIIDTCIECDGTGVIENPCHTKDDDNKMITCPNCSGRGKIVNKY